MFLTRRIRFTVLFNWKNLLQNVILKRRTAFFLQTVESAHCQLKEDVAILIDEKLVVESLVANSIRFDSDHLSAFVEQSFAAIVCSLHTKHMGCNFI